MVIATRILHSQTRAIKEALEHLLLESVGNGHPADRTLAAYFRRHGHLGGRDRRLIADTVFSVFRWWGWLRPLAPSVGPTTDRTPARPVFSPSYAALFLAARLAEGGIEDEISGFWAAECGLPHERMMALFSPREPSERISALFEELGVGRESDLRVTSLLPGWALDEAAFATRPDEWIPWFQRRPPLWLRIQRADEESVIRDLRNAGLQVERHPRLRRAVRVGEGGIRLNDLPVYREGAVEIQDLASQAVSAVCAPAPGDRWWDACAGGGGKSLPLAEVVGIKGSVTASDIREHKLGEILRRARRGGFANIRVRRWDGQARPGTKESYDGVLVDAPCSGSGTWRRNPADRWMVRKDRIQEMASRQLRILLAASEEVRPGGFLVYATCSFFRAENESVVKEFLAASDRFEGDRFIHPLTGETCLGTAALLPWQGDCDSMFVARLYRKHR